MKKLIYFLFFILLVSSVIAQPPFEDEQTSIISTGLQIQHPIYLYYPQYTDLDLHFHVHNSTNFALTNETTECIFHLYNQSGNHLIEDNLSFDSNGYDFYIDLNESTNKTGVFQFIVYCNHSSSNGQEAGFTANGFEITTDGREEMPQPTVALTLILLPLIFAIILMFFASGLGKDHTILKIALNLVSIPMYFASSHFASLYVYKYERFPELIETVANVNNIVGWIFYIILTYWLIYFIIVILKTVQKKKQEEIKYGN